MKKFITILILIFYCFISKGQSNGDPAMYPTINSAPYYKFNGFVQIADGKAFIFPVSDTNWHPRFVGTTVYKRSDRSTYQWTDDSLWVKIGGGGSGSTTFFGLTDVDSAGIQDGDIPYYDLASGNIMFQGSIIPPISSGSTTYEFEDSTNTPPVSFPVGFDTLYYMVGGAGTGIFSGHNYEVAMYVNEVFDSFIVPTVNDWGLTLDDGIWHQYDGSTWPRRNAPPWVTTGNVGGGILGSTNASLVYLRYNNANRIVLGSGTNAVRFTTMTGASAGLMGLSTTGAGSNVQIGSGLQLLAGVLSSTVSGGLSTADNGLTANTATNVRLGGSLIQNTTIDGAFTLNLNASRLSVNAADSILLASTNKTSINALDSANIRSGVAIYEKAPKWQGGGTIMASLMANTGAGDSTGYRFQISGAAASVGTFWKGATALGAGTFTDSLVAYNPSTNKQTYVSASVLQYWGRTAAAGVRGRIYPSQNVLDTVQVGSNTANNIALFNVSGTATIIGNAAIGSGGGQSTTEALTTGFGSATVTTSIFIGGNFSSTGASGRGLFMNANINTASPSTSLEYTGIFAQPQSSNQNYTTAPTSVIGVRSLPAWGTSNASSVVFPLYIGVEGGITFRQNNVKNVTAVYALYAPNPAAATGNTGVAVTYTQLRLDSLGALITNPIGINQKGTNALNWINGKIRFGDPTQATPTMLVQLTSGRFGQAKGADVASANDLTLGQDGNVFHITGTTQINAITTSNWQAGSVVVLIFDASVTVKNNTAGGGGTAVMRLAGGADFAATALDCLTLAYDGTQWYETARSVN